MNKNDILKYCTENNLYNVTEHILDLTNKYGFEYAIGSLGQTTLNIKPKSTIYNLIVDNSPLIDNGLGTNEQSSTQWLISAKGTTALTSGVLDPNYEISNRNYFCFEYQHYQYRYSSSSQINEVPSWVQRINQNLIITENDFIYWDYGTGKAWTDTYTNSGTSIQNLSITIPTVENYEDNTQQTICLEEMNLIRKLDSPWIENTSPQVNSIPIYDHFIHDTTSKYLNYVNFENLGKTRYFIIGDTKKNQLSFAAWFDGYNTNDRIFYKGLQKMDCPITLKNANIRYGLGIRTRFDQLPETHYFFILRPIIFSETNDIELVNWLKEYEIDL